MMDDRTKVWLMVIICQESTHLFIDWLLIKLHLAPRDEVSLMAWRMRRNLIILRIREVQK